MSQNWKFFMGKGRFTENSVRIGVAKSTCLAKHLVPFDKDVSVNIPRL
jgi:hypothetical protein